MFKSILRLFILLFWYCSRRSGLSGAWNIVSAKVPYILWLYSQPAKKCFPDPADLFLILFSLPRTVVRFGVSVDGDCQLALLTEQMPRV